MKHLFLILFSFLSLSANAQMDTIRVLSIGNSYARDAFGYAPMLMEELQPNVYVEFGILYIGGCTLQKHWTNASNKQEPKDYEFDFYTTADQRWTTTKRYSMQMGVKERQWDLIILQQQSYTSMDYKTHQPYLSNLVAFLKGLLPEVQFAWHFTPSYPDGSDRLTGKITSETMYRRTAIAAQQVMLHDDFDFSIPTATGIQNARTTVLDRLGDFGHMSHEGLHTADGIPCLIEGYITAQRLLAHYGFTVDITTSQLAISQQWLTQKCIPQPHGRIPDLITDEDYTLARLAAQAAIVTPYRITPIRAESTKLKAERVPSDSLYQSPNNQRINPTIVK